MSSKTSSIYKKKLNKFFTQYQSHLSMNHNIFNKIIDKVALNQWQQKIDQLNQEYHRYFEMTNDPQIGPYLKLKSNFCIISKFYNWRKGHHFVIYNHNVCYCFECQEKHPKDHDWEDVANIPKNY